MSVEKFIKTKYTPYFGDSTFLEGATERTKQVMKIVNEKMCVERKNKGLYSVDTDNVSGITNFKEGYISKELDIIVGLQSDEVLKRVVNPYGGLKMVKSALSAYNYKMSSDLEKKVENITTHNTSVFNSYTDEMLRARHSGIITGLPDAYGRGRIIGDYRRVALYGVDYLIKGKERDRLELSQTFEMTEERIRLLEEVTKQIGALKELKVMANGYGFDISGPAKTAKECIQWLYFGYLGAIKESNGAAMSLGRVSNFIDIYIEEDMKKGRLREIDAQELVDDFVIKLRVARHLRTPEYNELFAGDPMWITECLGGMCDNDLPLVTKTSYRMLNTLYALGASAEPNLTVLWADKLPINFKNYCAKVSCDTSAIQYENDDLMRGYYGDDYGIACCVSAMKLGSEMQYFGARANLPKLLLLAINGGRDEKTGEQIAPEMPVYSKDVLDYSEIVGRLDFYREWLANLYVKTMNIIHYQHDKSAYESLQMSLHDTRVSRYMAFGIAGLSVLGDSLSAIKYAKVGVVREKGIIVDYIVDGEFPKYGNDDDRVDELVCSQAELFYKELCKTKTYRNSVHTLSILTITSNVMYGLKTGSTLDGRKSGEPYAPGANPMHNREKNGALASLNSVSKIGYSYCRDGVSNTFSVVPELLGIDAVERENNLVGILDGYFNNKAQHININVMNKELLLKAYESPEEYPNLTIRVSGYAVNFCKLSKNHQREVISRTLHIDL